MRGRSLPLELATGMAEEEEDEDIGAGELAEVPRDPDEGTLGREEEDMAELRSENNNNKR